MPTSGTEKVPGISDEAVEAVAKVCSKCGEEKPLDAFYHNRREKDGRQSHCKACHKAEVSDWQDRNAAKESARKRRWRDENREREAERKRASRTTERNAATKRRHRKRHPQKQRARNLLSKAVGSGRITKPDTCEECGVRAPAVDLHAHHDDYSKPLDVRWLCRGCHEEHHRLATLTPEEEK